MPARIAENATKLNFVLPTHVREALADLARKERKSIAQVVREAIDQRVEEATRKENEAKLKEAYLGLAEENQRLAHEFRFVDAENVGEWGGER